MNAKEKSVQKALGTTKKFWTYVDVSFEMSVPTAELVEATSEDHAKQRLQDYLATAKGKERVLKKLLDDLMWNNRDETGEYLVETLRDINRSEITFSIAGVDYEDDSEEEEPTLPL